MKLKAYAVRDKGIEAFMPPFFARADGEAVRMFVHACKEGNLKQNAQDYALYHIGYFDDTKATMDNVSQPGILITGLEATSAEQPKYID